MTKILIKRGTATQWSSSTTPLASAELGLDTTNNILKAGNGTSLWDALNPIVLTSSQVDELARDAIGAALVGGTGISVNVNDAADSITISVDNTIATKSYTDTAVSNLVDSAPAALDTLNELAAALGDDANFATTVTNSIATKVSKSGGDTITPSTTSTIGLTLASPVGQTGHLLYAAGGTRIPAGGNYLVTPGLTVSYTSDFNAGAANIVPITVKGAASQTADLQQWQDSTGTVLAKVDASGNIYPNSITSTGGNANSFGGNTIAGVILAVNTNNATGVVVRGAGAQVNNLQEWQNSSGTALARIQSDGSLKIGAGTATTIGATYGQIFVRNATDYSAAINVSTGYLGTAGIIVRGVASQTANLQEWQNSAGTVLAKVDSTGQFTSNIQASSAISTPIVLQNSASGVGTGTALSMNYGGVNYVSIESAYATSPGSGGAYLSFKTNIVGGGGSLATRLLIDNNGTVTINGFTSAAQGLIIKAAASQTANLQEWQNSGGTVLASINASGQLELNGKDVEIMNIMGAY